MRSKKKILELNNRKKIHDFISKYPGVHFRKIVKNLNLSEGTIKFHLNLLVKNEYINKKNIMGYTRYFPSRKFGKLEKEILCIFRQEIPKNILIYLFVNFGFSLSELSKTFNKDKKTIEFHIKKLLDLDLIEPATFKNGMMCTNRKVTKLYDRVPVGRERIYRLTKPYLIYHLFIKHKNNFLDNGTAKEALAWIEFVSSGKYSKKYDNVKVVEDRVIDAFFEIFPFPWCA